MMLRHYMKMYLHILLSYQVIWYFMNTQTSGEARCPVEMGDPNAETYMADQQIQPNLINVDVSLKFERDSFVTSISVRLRRTYGYLTFGIFKLIGPLNDCHFEVIDTWKAENFVGTGWQTFEIPPTQYLYAQKGHYFGWFDPNPNGRGAVSFKGGNEARTCLLHNMPALSIGLTFQLQPLDFFALKRHFAVRICIEYQQESGSFTVQNGWSLDGFNLTSYDVKHSGDCAVLCYQHTICKAFLFATGSEVVSHKCQLKYHASLGTGQNFHADSAWNYWERQN